LIEFGVANTKKVGEKIASWKMIQVLKELGEENADEVASKSLTSDVSKSIFDFY